MFMQLLGTYWGLLRLLPGSIYYEHDLIMTPSGSPSAHDERNPCPPEHYTRMSALRHVSVGEMRQPPMKFSPCSTDAVSVWLSVSDCDYLMR